MNDKENKLTGDEEYQYPNEEYVTETTPASEQLVQEKQANFFARLIQNNKRVTVIIVLVLLALIGFKFFGSHQAPTPVQPTPQPVVQPVAQTPSPEMVNALSNLKQSEQGSENSINQLQSQVQSLQNQLNQTTSQQGQTNQAMLALVQQMKILSQDVKTLTAKKAPASHKKAVPTPPPIVFHLKAIVPGRAWIMSNDGLSESVSVGDTVPQYGTVQAVDANRGFVLTSSGKVIQYGPYDH